MDGLTLEAGGKLKYTRWVYDDAKETGDYVSADVTDKALSYLMEPVRLDGELCLRDIFLLLQHDRRLLDVFRRDWAEAYLASAFKTPATPYTGAYDAQGIEYLELYQLWNKDAKTGELEGVTHLDFHGIGFVLQDDIKEGEHVVYRKGARIPWGISFSPVHTLMNLPLRYNENVNVCEANFDEEHYGQVVEVVKVDRPTLAQVLHGILWELSFHGGPEDTETVGNALSEAAAQAKAARGATGVAT